MTVPAPPPRLLLWPGLLVLLVLLVGGSVGNWSSDTAGPSAAYNCREPARDEFPGASPAWLSPDAPWNVSGSVSVF